MAKRITTEEFINKAHEIYGNLYDYSKTDCENRDEKGKFAYAYNAEEITD